MLRSFDTSVLIVGAGPVGLTLAMELASRGVDVTVTETRRAGEPPNVKCNQVSARSMEIFRRLGLADRIRNTGLPPEYRNDVAMCVSVLGTELSRIKLPSRAGRVRGEKGADGHWPCAEWGHRINQLHLEPLLFAHAAAQPCIRILNRTQFEEFIQDSNVVTAIARDLDSGEPVTIRCRYLAGCDGGRSTVRKAIGAELAGIPIYQRVQSTYFRAPKLKSLLRGEPAWMYLAFNPRRCGTYQAERQPITDQVSRFAFNMAKEVSQQRREISADIERQDAVGEATRTTIGREAYDLYVQQQCCGGLNFGYFYADSPVIAYDGEAHPPYSMGRFTSSSMPGCRAPHFWLRDGRSLYDALGPNYTLIRFDPTVRVAGIVEA